MGPLGVESAAVAWEFLRRNARYREAYGYEARAPAFEPGPFPVRIQSEADRAAAPFALLSFENPDATAGAGFPFFAEAPMLEGELVAGARPLLPLLARAGACVEGLRLLDGGLILKIERGRDAAQVRLAAAGPFPDDAALMVRLEYGLPLPVLVERLKELWALAHGPAPRHGRVRGEDMRIC